jgi:FkbM family methyltransferase
MKQIVKKIFNFFGLKISRIHPDIKELTFDEIYTRYLKTPLIFDVGANEGQTIDRFKKIFKNPIIHSFEPIPNEFKKLEKKYGKDKNVILNNFAIGETEGENYLNVTMGSGSSSLVDFIPDTNWLKNRSKQYNVETDKYIKEKIKVKIVSLDKYCEKNNINKIDILKIDTQAYEDKVLKGSKEILKKQLIFFIEAEIILKEYYEKYFSFSDIENLIIPNNYRLCSINLANNNIFDGTVFFTDNLYVNKKLLSINKNV